ncbi:MAG: hypothetical protein Kow0092_04380 [Deferrisomatales bacterium]
MIRALFLVAAAGLAALAAPPAGARTKLAALPEREAVTVRLDHPEATLVEEERVLPLHEGENWVDFSWKGVQIDPDSIRLEFLSHPGEVTLLSVAYPPGEAALVWRLHAPQSAEERVRISYLLGGIDRLVAYKAVANREETAVALEGVLVLRNFSGEDFAAARVHLGRGEALSRPVAHEETRRARLFAAPEVPVRKTFTWDAALHPWEPKRERAAVGIPVHYVLRNDPDSGLGAAPLWAGKVRVFQDGPGGGTLFLGEDRIGPVPVGEETRIRVGDSREVMVTQQKTRAETIHPRPSREHVLLYDTDEELVATVENFKDEPVTVDLVEHIPGQWELVAADAPHELRDASTLVLHVEVAPREARKVSLRYHRRNVRR